jgi:hypothetical protein
MGGRNNSLNHDKSLSRPNVKKDCINTRVRIDAKDLTNDMTKRDCMVDNFVITTKD